MICIIFAFIATLHVCNSGWSLLMWFDIQSKSLNSAGEGTASRPEPDGTDFFFSSITHTRLGHSLIFFFVCFSRVQAEFLSYCFPDIHSYKIILIVLRKFVVNCRIFFSSSIKSDLFNSVFSVAILKRSTWARKFGIRVMTSGIAFDRPDQSFDPFAGQRRRSTRTKRIEALGTRVIVHITSG